VSGNLKVTGQSALENVLQVSGIGVRVGQGVGVKATASVCCAGEKVSVGGNGAMTAVAGVEDGDAGLHAAQANTNPPARPSWIRNVFMRLSYPNRAGRLGLRPGAW
jgi:hypothetical protein